MIDWLKHPLLREIVNILQAKQIEAYLVGGAVRDLLLNRSKIVDLDFAVPDNGLATARLVANTLKAAFYPLDSERGTGRVVYEIERGRGSEKSHLDFATFRGPTLLADLADRDFTINAIALSLTDPPQLIDPLQGQRDLESGQIRVAADGAFQRDPVRVLRAIRQATEFDFVIEPQTKQALRQAAPGLTRVSAERQRDEFLKVLNTPAPGQAVQALHQLEVLPHLLPEVERMVGVEQSPPHYLDVFEHTAATLTAWARLLPADFAALPAKLRPNIKQYLNRPLSGDLTIRSVMPLALLLHDTGKPLTRTVEAVVQADYPVKIRFLGHEKESAKISRQVMSRLRFSSQTTSFVESVVAHHMRPLLLAMQQKRISRRAIYRLFRDTGGRDYQAGVAVALHAWADHQATYPPGRGQSETEALLKVITALGEAYFEQHTQVVDPPLLLTGRDLIRQFNLKEGRLVGLLLGRLKEAQATGQVHDKAEALAFIEADPDFVNYRKSEQPLSGSPD